jgi:hypothetical protein
MRPTERDEATKGERKRENRKGERNEEKKKERMRGKKKLERESSIRTHGTTERSGERMKTWKKKNMVREKKNMGQGR